jgi:putative transposase
MHRVTSVAGVLGGSLLTSGKLRDECLNASQFLSIDDARRKFNAWWEDYNHHRPHSSLGNLTPSEYFRRGQQRTNEAADF